MTTQNIDFGTLSLMDALDLATLVEEEACERYGELATQLEVHHTPEAATFFRKMERVEEMHRAELEKRRRERFGDTPRRVRREMIFDIEAPEYDEVRAGMSVRAALEAAMRSEVKAHDFFVAALPTVTDPEVETLFAELRDEEIEHQAWVRLELAREPAETVDAGEVDEPVAH